MPRPKRPNSPTFAGKRIKTAPAVASIPTPAKPEPVPEPVKVAPKRTPRPAPPAPEPPNPHVLELQGQIIKLVNMREDLQERESIANHDAAQAQARLQSARSSLQRVEQEVNYRIELIARLTGVPTTPSSAYGLVTAEMAYAKQLAEGGGALQSAYAPPIPISGIGSVGSIPPSRPMVGGGPEGNVRMDSAEDIRRSL